MKAGRNRPIPGTPDFPTTRRSRMTATDLLHHVFPWELTTGIARLEADELESDEDA
jgi:hypothetical protein